MCGATVAATRFLFSAMPSGPFAMPSKKKKTDADSIGAGRVGKKRGGTMWGSGARRAPEAPIRPDSFRVMGKILGAETAKASRRIWTREETLVAFNLYCSMPFGQIHDYDPRIVKIADLLGRKSSSVSMKMCNLASYDPKHIKRGVKGLSRPCKTERLVWDEFKSAPGEILYESEQLLARLKNAEVAPDIPLEPEVVAMPEGREKERIVMARVNQGLFRRVVLSSYNNACCVTGINESALLVASHIVPWRDNLKERLNPRNGLCLNALHDRAFDRGLISIDSGNIVRVSRRVLKAAARSEKIAFVAESDGAKIRLPDKFRPRPEFLKYHHRNIFVDA